MRKLTIFLFVLLITTCSFAQKQADFPTNTDTAPMEGAEESLSASSGRLLSTHRTGAVGLFRTISAQKQPSGPTSFGLFLSGNYYVLKSFPAASPYYISERLDSDLGISYTPSDLFEFFVNVGYLKTNNEPPTNPLYTQKANLGLGAKFSYPFTNSFSAGLVYAGEKRNAVSNIAKSAYALNHEIRGVATYDTQNRMRYHGNAGFRIDNNSRVAGGVTSDQRALTILHAHENNLILLALGAEYLAKWATFSAEYSMDYVMASSEGLRGQPQRISLGTRIFPTSSRILALQLGADLGFLSKSTSKTVVKEPTYAFNAGISCLFGMKKRYKAAVQERFVAEEEDLTKDVKKEEEVVEATSMGRISGYITDIESGDPVVDAKLFVCDDPTNPIVSDSSGRYQSESIKAGSCELRIEHPDYKTSKETVEIAADAEQPLDFGLLKASKGKGALLIRVKDVEGNPTASTISFPDFPDIAPVDTNEFGQAKIQITSGNYSVKAESPNMKPQIIQVELAPKQDLFVDFALESKSSKKPIAEKPSTGTVQISKDKKSIVIPKKINFKVGKSLLTKESEVILDEVASILKKNPDIKKVQIGGHTDSSGDADRNMELSQERAFEVKSYLVTKGINKDRLEAKGFGSTKPIADNEEEEGRNQNRRVEFKIVAAPEKSGVKK